VAGRTKKLTWTALTGSGTLNASERPTVVPMSTRPLTDGRLLKWSAVSVSPPNAATVTSSRPSTLSAVITRNCGHLQMADGLTASTPSGGSAGVTGRSTDA
jgi:hypothetical protein